MQKILNVSNLSTALAIVSMFTLYLLIDKVSFKETAVVIETCEEEIVGDIIVEISGAVNSPGVYSLDRGSRVVSLLSKAEGLGENIHLESVTKGINLARVLEDGEKVYIPFEWDEVGEIASVESFIDRANVSEGSGLGQNSTDNRININSASIPDLTSLSGVGEVYASRIQGNTPYADIGELEEKAELPASLIEKIKDNIYFD